MAALCWLMLFSVLLNTLAIVLWKDNIDSDIDLARLQGHENLIYFSAGTPQFNLDIIANISKALSIDMGNKFCFNVGSSMPSIGSHLTSKSLLIVNGIEETAKYSKKKALDFVFKLSDSSTEYSQVVTVLLFNYVGPAERFAAAHWKSQLATLLNSDSDFVNGYALSGRINRGAIQEMSGASSVVAPVDICTHLLSASPPALDEKPQWDIVVALLLVSLPISIYFMFQRRTATNSAVVEAAASVLSISASTSLPTGVPLESKPTKSVTRAEPTVPPLPPRKSRSSRGSSGGATDPSATPPALAFDSDLFRAEYLDSIRSTEVKQANLAEDIAAEPDVARRSNRTKRSGSGAKRNETAEIFEIANRLSFGSSASRSPCEIAAPASNGDGEGIVRRDSRDISMIHVTIDETSAPVRLRGRRKASSSASAAAVEDSVPTRRHTRSQDISLATSGQATAAARSNRGRAVSDGSGKARRPAPADA